jgi:RHS repeat-associated protein
MELRAEGNMFCVYHWHGWRTAVEKLWFRRLTAGQFRLEKISPPCGFGLVLAYDPEGRLSSVTQMIEGRRILFRYNKRGLTSELLVESPSSRARPIVAYFYDQHDRLIEVRDATDAPIRYAYDKSNHIVKEETRSGAVFQMRYDDNGRCVRTCGSDGYHACGLRYLMAGRLTLVTNSLGSVTAYEFNGSGQVVKETRPNSAELVTRYDEFGRIVEEVDSLGRTTKYHYDEHGNTIAVEYPSGLGMEARYDLDHQPTMFRQGQSIWRFSYVAGQLISVIDPTGVERRYGYDESGFLISMVEPSGNSVRIQPNEGWTRVKISDDYGFDREEHYNDLMYITQISEPDGSVYRFDFDNVGKLIRATAPGSSPKEYRYDAGEYLASTKDADGYLSRLRHNAHGFIEQILTPIGRTYECAWDTEGHLKTWVNPAGERAEFKHDDAGNEIEVRHFDGRVETSEFDIAGRRIRRRLADGTEISFDYDISNNMVRIYSGGIDLIVSDYDVEGRLLRTRTPDSDVSFEYDVGHRIVAEIQNGRRIEYTYNRIGVLTARTFSDSPLPPLKFEWDRRLRLVSIRRGDSLVQKLSYNAKDQCVERRFGDCTEKLEYSVSGSVVAQTVIRENWTLISRSWSYDRRGNVVSIDDRRSGEKRYQFDGDHRLVKSWTNGVGTDYGYDAGGNLTSWRGGPQSRTFEYLSGNRLTRTGTTFYERDANGNVIRILDGGATTSLSWNALGQLVEVRRSDGTLIKYAYDGLGRRLRLDASNAVTEFIWSGEQLLAEVSAGVTTEYLFAEFNPTIVWRGAKVFHLINSHLGVPHEALTGWGHLAWSQRLGDWGNLERVEGEADGRIPFRFPGQYADDGLYYNRFRYYDPRACQYLSPDPQGLGAGANEYMYCPNPVNWVDLFGLSCGIPPGQHSVYVLEKGKRATSGPPPTPAVPPTPPVVIYVGITRQSPHDRLAQHKASPPGGVTPDGMRIIATGPNGTPPVPDRVAARLIEASILTNAPQKGQPGALNNAGRPVNPGYYHSNVPSAAPPGTTHLPASTTNGLLSPTNGTTIT